MSRRRLFIGAAALVSLTACVLSTDFDGLSDGARDADVHDGGSGSDVGFEAPPEPLVTLAAACKHSADAQCNRYAACQPRDLQEVFGGPVSCSQRLEAACVAIFSLSDLGLDPARFDRCAGDLQAVSCTDFADGRSPASCLIPGKRRVGARCADFYQCDSLNCVGPASSVCGTCQVAGQKPGDSCANGCAQGLACPAEACVQPVGLGAVCDANAVCAASYQCVAGKCAPFAQLDQPCSAQVSCATRQGLECNPSTAKCAAVVFAQPGESCGIVNGRPTACTGGICSNQRCVALSWIGQPCMQGGIPGCMFPSLCVAGQCMFAAESLCP